jgi:hypothetical protein
LPPAVTVPSDVTSPLSRSTRKIGDRVMAPVRPVDVAAIRRHHYVGARTFTIEIGWQRRQYLARGECPGLRVVAVHPKGVVQLVDHVDRAAIRRECEVTWSCPRHGHPARVVGGNEPAGVLVQRVAKDAGRRPDRWQRQRSCPATGRIMWACGPAWRSG